MTSVLASPAQTPSRVGYFKVSNQSSSTLFYPEPFVAQLTVGSNGVTAIVGNEITVDTYANVTALLTDGASTPFVTAALVNGQFFRDMGKSWHFIVGGYRVATATKVQRYGADGQATEGVLGNSNSSLPASVGKQYNTGFVLSWSANPSTLPIAVTRTGY